MLFSNAFSMGTARSYSSTPQKDSNSVEKQGHSTLMLLIPMRT